MKSMARGYFWWPGIDREIELLTKKCDSCSKYFSDNSKIELHSWTFPSEPWERLHIDYLGPFKKKFYLIVVDSYTKWLEVCETSTTSSLNTIECLRSIFATFGLPKFLVSDNASSFSSQEFSEFLHKNRVIHVTSPPYNPSSNGAAENCVKLVKGALVRALTADHESNTKQIICRFLLDYRNTVHCTTGVSPANLMFGRALRTKFDLMNPYSQRQLLNKNDIKTKVKTMQIKQKQAYKGRRKSNYLLGEVVLVKDYRDRSKVTWIKGIVNKQIGKCTYFIEIPELRVSWKRHANQIRKTIQPDIFTSGISVNEEMSTRNKMNNENDESENFENDIETESR